jgi:hypothetical protein
MNNTNTNHKAPRAGSDLANAIDYYAELITEFDPDFITEQIARRQAEKAAEFYRVSTDAIMASVE